MDSKKLIASGILERYLLGELSEKEAAEIETHLKENLEIKEYYQQLEADLELMAQENAINPPPEVKESLFEKIASESPQMNATPNGKSGRPYYLFIAASLALFFGLATLWLFSKIADLENAIEVVAQENEVLKNDLEQVTTNFEELDTWYTAINDPNTVQLILKGNTLSPNATAISYVNHREKKVILNSQGLPRLSATQDYQMWADVNGEMIDMGVIKKGEDMLAMTYIENAESLNITIEPAGGSDHPTVSNLIANIYL